MDNVTIKNALKRICMEWEIKPSDSPEQSFQVPGLLRRTPRFSMKRILMDKNRMFPPHILPVIFSKLPAMNLPAIRLVCKSWNHLILNQFSNHHKITPQNLFLSSFPRSQIHCVELDPKYLGVMNFVGSASFPANFGVVNVENCCNGLLLISKLGGYSILNPMTNEYIELPDPKVGCLSYGFGFSPKTKVYKVVRCSGITMSNTMDIFTFCGSNSNRWRQAGSVPFLTMRNGVYLNGALYWFGVDFQDKRYGLCRFDVETEKIETMFSSPWMHMNIQILNHMNIQILNGNVYAIRFSYSMDKLEAWKMQKFGSWEDSWTTEFVISGITKEISLKIIKIYDDGEILLLYNTGLGLYNPKFGRFKMMKQFQKGLRYNSCAIDFINFASLRRILSGE